MPRCWPKRLVAGLVLLYKDEVTDVFISKKDIFLRIQLKKTTIGAMIHHEFL